jgi:hypothetical protein
MPAIGQGASYSPGHWNVYVQALNRYLYFPDQASAQQDIQAHNAGQLMGPNGAQAARAAPTGKVGEGPSYNPAHWNVHVAALNKFIYFADQNSANADIARFGAGQLVQPNSSFSPPRPAPVMQSTPAPQAQPSAGAGGAPPSSTGWWQVHSGSKSWKFTDPALAMRCAQATGGRISGNVSASSMPQVANPQGPTYT